MPYYFQEPRGKKEQIETTARMKGDGGGGGGGGGGGSIMVREKTQKLRAPREDEDWSKSGGVVVGDARGSSGTNASGKCNGRRQTGKRTGVT